MVVKMEVEKKLEELRNTFFELVTLNKIKTFEELLLEFTKKLKAILHADLCSLYFLDEWSGSYQRFSSESIESTLFRSDIPMEDIIENDHSCLINREWIKAKIVIGSLQQETSVFPMLKGQTVEGFLVIGPVTSAMASSESFEVLAKDIQLWLSKMKSYYSAHEEKRKYELLYRVTTTFHSSIKTDGVLREIIETLKEIYPAFDYYLLLSQDYSKKDLFPVKEISYGMEEKDHASTQAFLTGELQMENRIDEQQSYLYAPLKGKQGVYGVLQIIAPSYLHFPEKDLEFFVLIANTAGNALENAHLYQQSRRLNRDLKLMNSISHQLNTNNRLKEKIAYTTYQIKQSFEAEEVGFVTFGGVNEEEWEVLDGSTDFFISSASDSFIAVIKRLLSEESGPLFLGDYHSKVGSSELPIRSVMAVPMKDHQHLNGVAIVLHNSPYFFTFDSFRFIQSLVRHSTLAFANSMLREKLEKTVITDYLTRLHSRNYLDECMENHLKKDEEGHLILFDIDNFKQINDIYGHQTGDDVLRQVAVIIKSHLGDSALAARWGGEELAVYLSSISEEEAFMIADAIRDEISLATDPIVTVSCGLASWKMPNCPNSKQLVKQADRALYQAKEYGKDRLIVAEAERFSSKNPR